VRIGVDVGGTNTDAVLMDGKTIKAAHKAATTQDVSGGIVNAIRAVLDETGVAPAQITAVMIGTTQFTNAFVERRSLLPVAIFRIALPATAGLPPLVDWPEDFRSVIGENFFLVRGGFHYDGRPSAPLDEAAIADAARKMRQDGLTAAAVTAMFSPVSAELEERAAEIIKNENPDAVITLSARIGRIGLIERENAAVMNASLAQLAQHVVQSFREALLELEITAPFHISQNDGTLMTSERVEQYPVLTFASGPTNSMRGAAYLSGVKEALVADIGGTTTDIGMLSNGFPRESSVAVDIGKVRTNFRMPDIFAIGLGGGSLVKENSGDVTIGPQSVGYKLTKDALVFGGDTLTATDIAVAAGATDIGDASNVKSLDRAMVAAAHDRMHAMIADAADQMKTSAEPIPLILVGGGSVLVDRDISGTSETIIPENADVANAIGASIAQVGGEVDKVFSYEACPREEALEIARNEAKSAAVAAGAQAETVDIIDIEEVPLAYVPGRAVRVRVKVAGDLNYQDHSGTQQGGAA